MLEFSTQSFVKKEGFDLWHSLFVGRESLMDLRHQEGGDFQGQLRLLVLGGVKYSFYQCSPCWVLRSPEHIRRDDDQHYFLYLPLDGSIQLEHNNRYYCVNAGECALIDAEFPLRSCQSARNCLSLRIPKRNLPNLEHGRIRMLRRHERQVELQHLQKHLLALPVKAQSHDPLDLERELSETLLLLFAPGRFESKLELYFDKSFQQICGQIKERHKETLNVRAVADELGISDSSFYNILRRNKSSFRGLLKESRLHSALSEISLRPQQTLLHSAVGSGFSNGAHFSREFKSRFGITAQEFQHFFSFA